MNRRTKLIIILLIISVLIQLLLITYKHVTGFVYITSITQFLVTLTVGTIFSFIIAGILVLINTTIIRIFDNSLAWREDFWKRTFFESLATISIGIGLGLLFTFTMNRIRPYQEPLHEVYLYNAVIVLVVNIIMVTIIEAVLSFKRQQDSLLQAARLQRENVSLRFETLKKQLDPHFLFNSLNVLSSLIRKDVSKSQDFIDEFSSIYRYTLEVIDKPVVTLDQEIQFARSYLFLQSIRFENALQVDMDLAQDKLEQLVPPLSVQSLLENALKHNIATENDPLQIHIRSLASGLLISNKLQSKPDEIQSSGIGFENLKSRYSLISDALPEVKMTEDEYIVTLPYIEVE
mgnify:CR=1 FL=1